MEKNSKKWSMVNYIFLWIGVCFSIPTFMVTETLWNYGLSVIQILVITSLASLLMGILMVLVAFVSYDHGMSFTNLVEQCFGKKLSKAVLFFRMLVCSGWFGINVCFCCETIINTFFQKNHNSRIVIYVLLFICFSITNLLLSTNNEIIRNCEKVSSVILLLFFIIIPAVLFFFYKRNVFEFNLVNTIILKKGSIFSSFMLVFVYWSGFVTNIPDFINKGKTIKSVIYGNTLGITIGMLLVVSISLFFCGFYKSISNSLIWNPITAICNIFHNKYINIISCLMMIIFMFTTNIASNSYPAIKCIKRIFKCQSSKSMLILLLVSCLFCPWYLISSANSFSMYWINTYSIFSLPLISVFISSRMIGYRQSNKRISVLYLSICAFLLIFHILSPQFDNITLIISALLPLFIGVWGKHVKNNKNNCIIRN